MNKKSDEERIEYSKVLHKGVRMREHRVLAEKALGKPLPPRAEIHHLNGKKFGPIIICQDRAYHCFLHLRMKALMYSGNVHFRKCVYCKMYDSPENLKWKRNSSYGYFLHQFCANKYLVNWIKSKKNKV